MRIIINLDKREANGKPTVHVTPEEVSFYKNGHSTPKLIEIELIEHGATYTIGKLKPYTCMHYHRSFVYNIRFNRIPFLGGMQSHRRIGLRRTLIEGDQCARNPMLR